MFFGFWGGLIPPFLPIWGFTKKGRLVCLRPILATDIAALLAFEKSLSKKALGQRFNGHPALSERIQWERLKKTSGADHVNDMVFIAISISGKILGVVEIHRDGPLLNRAEIAFLVGDRAQSEGIATELTRRILWAARIIGIVQAYAFTQMDNAAMIHAFLSWGFTLHYEDGEVQAKLELT